LLLTVVTAAFVVLTVALGNWQLRRAVEKQARIDLLAARQREPVYDLNAGVAAGELRPGSDAGALAWRIVRASGAYLGRDQLLIDNRVHNHIAGYHVVAPMELAGSRDIVLINRGWLAPVADRSRVAAPPIPAGAVTVQGIAASPASAGLRLGQPAYPDPGAGDVLWPELDLARFRAATGLAILPFVIEQTAAAPDGLVREWPAPPDDVPMHKAYALQWYTFGVIALGLYVGLNLKRPRGGSDPKAGHG
jgi:surfeit locus 1 family protein